VTISQLYSAVMNVFGSKRGAAMVEYALLVGLIAVVAMAAVQGLGNGLSTAFTNVTNSL
jgi:pilus assembly protein Flp/PilA